MAARVASSPGRGCSLFKQVSPTAWMALAFLGLFVTPFGWAYQNLALRLRCEPSGNIQQCFACPYGHLGNVVIR